MTAPAPPAADLIRSSVYCSMVHLVQRLTTQVAPRLTELGLDPTAYFVLGNLFAEPGQSASDLARASDLSPQRLALLLDRWEQAGLVERSGVRGRGRRTSMALTAHGLAMMAAAWPAVKDAGSAQTLNLTPDQAGQLLALLQAAGEPTLAIDDDVVVLVDDDGTPTGTAPRRSVHTARTPLHLAFSTYLQDGEGRVLLTRRALTKATWPGVWTNSVCGHLRPGETAAEAAQRRVPEEIGAPVTGLETVLPHFRYQAVDASGLHENELCPVLTGTIDPDEVTPDPAEICETAWVSWADLFATARATPALLSPWCLAQLRELEGKVS